jgi:hypothetical protein
MAAPRTTRTGSQPHAARRPRRREAHLSFEALAIEGGLLSPEWLARVAGLDAGSQDEADYRIPKGLQLRDEIGRYWRIAQAHWKDFAAGRASATKPEATRALSERFVLALLRESFGFESLVATPTVVIAERSYPIGFASLGGRVPVVIAPAGSGLDILAPATGDGGRRRSVFGLAQEYLNAAEGATWGLATDGLALRILRDNASLTRPAWIEADLVRIFTEERYADFAALWLLAHETRFGRTDRPAADCALETWREAGREEGTRAREHLRTGVEEALVALGQGFLGHPDNTALRAALQKGSLSTAAYFQELLRLVYRLIFLLTVEERGLLHPASALEPARLLYAGGYGLRRLRERSLRRSAHDRFSDLWETTKIVFRSVAAGEPRLALPALAGIFAPDQCPTLDAGKLENRALLLAVFRLSWLREASGLARVNWRDMGPEELGSVYESLLELVPQVTQGGRQFAFATGGEAKGNARKTSGSYYTPDSLVQVLLDSALEPVVASILGASPERPAEALLEISIVDPACGSGHFLLAAARRLAGHLARLQANGTPSAVEYRHALRQVVGRCLYGVDLNPMAVELCKVSLWMEAVEPGLPLTFLDAHILRGHALLGTTPELMANGIPDVAWKPIEGDDRKVASALKTRNKRSGEGQRALDTLWTKSTESDTAEVARAVAELEAAPDTDVESLARKEGHWEDLLDSEAYRHQKLVADAWCAAFVWPKQPGTLQDAAPTNDVWLQIRDRRGHPNPLTVKATTELAEQYSFFHWHLAFPQVFERGFDVVLGNPPWEKLKLQEREWFAAVRPVIANAQTAAIRGQLIEQLKKDAPEISRAFALANRQAEGETACIVRSGRFPLSAVGDTNTYPLFVELAMNVGSRAGRVGLIVKTGLLSDYSLRGLFAHLVQSRRLVSGFDFSNRKLVFPAVVANERFTLLTLAGRGSPSQKLSIAVLCEDVSDLRESGRVWDLSPDDVTLINPNTRTCPLFQCAYDATVVASIYRRVPILTREYDPTGGNPWSVQYYTMFHMTNDSSAFRDMESLEAVSASLPSPLWDTLEGRFSSVLEGKLFAQYDHRHGTFLGVPRNERFGVKAEPNHPSEAERQDPAYQCISRFWIHDATVESNYVERLEARPGGVLVFRDVCRTHTDVRTVRAAICPSYGAGNKAPLLIFPGLNRGEQAKRSLLLAGVLNSFVLDYVARQKFAGGSLNKYILLQFPILAFSAFDHPCPWGHDPDVSQFVMCRAIELTYTAWDLEPFARDIGYDGPPFRWDPERRFLLRAELDAAFFHLYGLSRDDTAYILDTFPIVRKNDEKAHGEYRTKRVILEIYDAMAEAARTGRPYATRLDPPPADPRIAHPQDPTRKLTKEAT